MPNRSKIDDGEIHFRMYAKVQNSLDTDSIAASHLHKTGGHLDLAINTETLEHHPQY
jgi:hypothetical protein